MFWKHGANAEHPRWCVISIIQITLRRGSSPLNLFHIFRTPFYTPFLTLLEGSFCLSYLIKLRPAIYDDFLSFFKWHLYNDRYQENSHPKKSHPSNFSLENSHPSNSPLENSHPENSHPENSHLEYSYPIFPPEFLNFLFFHYCHRHHWYYLKDCFVILFCFKSA